MCGARVFLCSYVGWLQQEKRGGSLVVENVYDVSGEFFCNPMNDWHNFTLPYQTYQTRKLVSTQCEHVLPKPTSVQLGGDYFCDTTEILSREVCLVPFSFKVFRSYSSPSLLYCLKLISMHSLTSLLLAVAAATNVVAQVTETVTPNAEEVSLVLRLWIYN